MDRGREPGERVTLRFATVGDAPAAALFERHRDLLSEDERERCERFPREDARRRFLVARVLVRQTLSSLTGAHPAEWRFAVGVHGKPEIVGPGDLPPPRFNLSHTEGLCACAVAFGHDVGVDVEAIGRRVSFDAIARRCMSEEERRALEAAPAAKRAALFFEFWTLKEALAKAIGRGMTLPFAGLSFRTGATPSVTFPGVWQDDPAAWRFFLVRPDSRHCCAVAVRGGRETELHLDWEATITRGGFLDRS